VLAPLIAFVATVALIYALRPVALHFGLTDKPGQRKRHDGEVPLIGGIAVFLAVIVSVLLGRTAGSPISDHLLAMLAGSCLLVVVGAYDDVRELPAWLRLAAQAIAALIMVYWGDNLLADLGAISPTGNTVGLGHFAISFTVFASVGIINAVNMSDGLDGLSGNLSLVTLLAFGIGSSLWGGPASVPLLNVVSAAIAGFLLFNQRMLWRSRAAVFLGDAGSMLLGYFLVWTAIEMSQGPERILHPAAVLWLLMIPIYDTVRVMLSRMLQGKSPFAADSNHLHHLFVRTGFEVSETIAIICMIAATGASVGLLGSMLGVTDFVLAITFVAVGILYFFTIERAWRRMFFLGKAIEQL
jgi:UDP-GlcNAc:undecaprenyl-phosphate GlcNAc-1-phosphate transferase